MTGYVELNLLEMVEQLGENVVNNILSNFLCPLNPDVEDFLKRNAILFSKQGISSTYLIFASYKEEPVLVGYYTLANKFITVYKENLKSKNLQRRINRFAQFDKDLKRYTLSAPLIGQLGKNYANNYNKLITGDELLKFALDRVKKIQQMLGGKIVYLECEEVQFLTDFYNSNGFVDFGRREKEKDELSSHPGKNYIQLLKYIK